MIRWILAVVVTVAAASTQVTAATDTSNHRAGFWTDVVLGQLYDGRASVCNNVISFADWELLERFTRPGSLHSSNAKIVAGQRWHLEAIMNAPKTSGLAGLLNCCSIKQPIYFPCAP